MVRLYDCRLRAASVLVIGLRGLGAEVCKNVVLAGVKGMTVMDACPLGPEDAGGRFLMFTEGENVSIRVSCTPPCSLPPLSFLPRSLIPLSLSSLLLSLSTREPSRLWVDCKFLILMSPSQLIQTDLRTSLMSTLVNLTSSAQLLVQQPPL